MVAVVVAVQGGGPDQGARAHRSPGEDQRGGQQKRGPPGRGADRAPKVGGELAQAGVHFSRHVGAREGEPRGRGGFSSRGRRARLHQRQRLRLRP